MKPKVKGMTSLEIAVIVAIVLIIAVAVGWYLYTTFVASTTGQPRLNVVSAEVYAGQQSKLKLTLVNPGPVDVEIGSVELSGQVYQGSQVNCQGTQQGTVGPVIKVGGQATCEVTLQQASYVAGTMLPGRVILSGGQSFPFQATVKPSTQ